MRPDEAAAASDLAYFDHWAATEDALFTVAVVGDTFIYEGINPACERMVGLSEGEIAGRAADQLLPAADAALVSARYRQCVTEGRALTYLETLQFPTGTSDWRTHLEPVRDANGAIVRLLGRARPLESLEAPPEDLTEGEFRKALDIFPLGIAVLDANGVILHVNATWRNFAELHGGVPVVEVIGVRYVDVCDKPGCVGLPPAAAVAERLRQLMTEDGGQFGLAYVWRERHFVLRAARVTLDGRVRVSMAHQDVTDIVRGRELAARSLEQILQAQEEERARIAMEVHDSTAQHLVALGLSMTKLRDTNVPAQVVDDMRQSLAEAHREIRTLSYLLYPPKLSHEGLVTTLQTFIDGFGRRTGLVVAFMPAGALSALTFDIQRTVFRIVQEALSNVHRHADARRAYVKVELTAKGLHVSIVDDGHRGRDGGDRTVGVGIRGMQARFAQFGGELTVNHGLTGTVVDGFLPRSKLAPAAAR